jgi:lysosomal Pro-X carboxypeptidase
MNYKINTEKNKENLKILEVNKKKIIKNFLKSKITFSKNSKIIDNYIESQINNQIIGKDLENKNKNDYEEKFMDIKLDHFSYEDERTFPLRYLIKNEFFDKNDPTSPILFYCGNEGRIEDFWENSGFLTDYLASRFKALVIFGEHRFFGKSFPFGGKQDKDSKKNRYLTSEQALSDFVELLVKFKKENNISEKKIIAFGGSYGGMLSSWARMKFPHVFSGAVASSAPTLLFEDITLIQNSFFKIATDTYRRYDNNCPNLIRSGFEKLLNIRNSKRISKNKSVLKSLNDIFKPCKKIENSYDVKKLEATIEDALITLAQYNYPYETNFIYPTLGDPVKVACEKISEIKNNTQLLNLDPIFSSSINFAFSKYNQIDIDTTVKFKYLKVAIDVLFNYTNTQTCLDIGNDDSKISELNGWEYMACTEMIMPMEKNGITDMFNPEPWNLENYSKECKNKWKSDVRPDWIYDYYGGRNFLNETKDYSNIIYINGIMDPWYAGCPKKSNNNQVVILEADSAHHMDLRSPNEKDPESVTQVRQVIQALIEEWTKISK